jgi:aspartyl-tRNA(Asn)/glutamyl-tRNA(Gln) amidotransferase subunit C
MAITRTDVEKVALLARLRLSEAELDTLTDELAQIITYVDHLAEVDTEGVEPMAHAVEVSNVFSTDEVQPSLSREQALANAPSRNERGYLVPAVLGG